MLSWVGFSESMSTWMQMEVAEMVSQVAYFDDKGGMISQIYIFITFHFEYNMNICHSLTFCHNIIGFKPYHSFNTRENLRQQ